MLTSSSHYYSHHEYLQPLPPLPSAMNSKQSPLALLAQTCNSIGKDPTPPKSTDKKDGLKDPETSRSNSAGSGKPSGDDVRTSETTNSDRERSSPTSTTKSSFRTPPPKDGRPRSHGALDISSKLTAAADDKSTSSSSSSSAEKDGAHRSGAHVTSSSSPHSSSSPSSGLSCGSLFSNSKIGLSSVNAMLDANHREAAALVSKARSSISTSVTTSDSLTAPLSSLPPGFGSYPPGLPGLFGHPLSLDSLYHAGLSAHSLAAHKGGLSGANSPYVSYATVRTSAGATTLVPVCKDPYCAHCQMTMRSAQLGGGSSTCAAGCAQCTHDKCSNLTSSLPQSVGAYGGLPLMPTPGLPAAAHSSLYPHMYSVLPGHHALPYVCNWVVGGSEHCGKRYATSEELLLHLRSHTSSGELSSLVPPSLSYGSLALTNPALCHPLSTPSLSPSALRQAYPRSLSPNTLLSASRYHPYKSALSSLPGPAGLGLPPSGLPGLGPYYSPYSLYGQRIGAAVGP